MTNPSTPDRFTHDPRADLVNELARLEGKLRTATLDRAQLIHRHKQVRMQLEQISRAS